MWRCQCGGWRRQTQRKHTAWGRLQGGDGHKGGRAELNVGERSAHHSFPRHPSRRGAQPTLGQSDKHILRVVRVKDRQTWATLHSADSSWPPASHSPSYLCSVHPVGGGVSPTLTKSPYFVLTSTVFTHLRYWWGDRIYKIECCYDPYLSKDGRC